MRESPQVVPVTTTTGELYLPTRLVYGVFDAKRLRALLPIRSCMEWSPEKRAWSWNYAGPVLGMGFPARYELAPKDRQAIVLAWCHLVDDQIFHVYTRCGFRAARFLEFFDRNVSRQIAFGKFIDQYNLVTMVAPGVLPASPEDFFRDESRMVFTDIIALMDQPESAARRKALKAHMADLAAAPLRPLERHRLEAFYHDGPMAFERGAQMQELLALEQSKSKTPICPVHVIGRILREQGDKFPGGPFP